MVAAQQGRNTHPGAVLPPLGEEITGAMGAAARVLPGGWALLAPLSAAAPGQRGFGVGHLGGAGPAVPAALRVSLRERGGVPVGGGVPAKGVSRREGCSQHRAVPPTRAAGSCLWAGLWAAAKGAGLAAGWCNGSGRGAASSGSSAWEFLLQNKTPLLARGARDSPGRSVERFLSLVRFLLQSVNVFLCHFLRFPSRHWMMDASCCQRNSPFPAQQELHILRHEAGRGQ